MPCCGGCTVSTWPPFRSIPLSCGRNTLNLFNRSGCPSNSDWMRWMIESVANPTYWAATPRTLPLILQLDHDRKKVLVTGVVVIEARLDLETLIPLPFGPYLIHKLERIGYTRFIHSSMTLDFQLNGDRRKPWLLAPQCPFGFSFPFAHSFAVVEASSVATPVSGFSF